MATLDRLTADIARLRAQRAPDDAELAKTAERSQARAEQSRREREAFQRAEETAAGAFAPSSALKKRFRQLAQQIHPDRARDETDRAWRTQLMAEANRAYRAGDAAALDEVFALWQEGKAVPPAPTFSPAGSASALARQVARMRGRIQAISAELDRLYGSKLYELYAATRVAARQGRDLLAEMAARLDDEIAAAQAELARLTAAVTA
ncbi:MAG: J domain-containing protein, partial [Rhodocyclaceae bacterium]|nr:J domain-containing protein [Rhodocyclaceae bacterium]